MTTPTRSTHPDSPTQSTHQRLDGIEKVLEARGLDSKPRYEAVQQLTRLLTTIDDPALRRWAEVLLVKARARL